MSAPKQNNAPSLGELEQLARNQSDDNWHNLLLGLTDHFLVDADEHTNHYGDAFSDIILRILEVVNTESRAELSNRVAALEQFPVSIVKHLATDEATVAKSVLEQSPILSDSDLLEIVGRAMLEHCVAIAHRKKLGRRLTGALVDTESAEVITEMVGNKGAMFSESTYRKVVEIAKQDTDLQEILVDRLDMPSTISVQLTPFLSDTLKKKLNKADGSMSMSLLDSLAEVTSGEPDKSEAGPAGVNEPLVNGMIERVKSGATNINAAVADLADHGTNNDVCALLADLSGLPLKNVSSALENTNLMPIAIICKSLGLSNDAFDAICHLRCESFKFPESEISTQIERFDELSSEEAQKTLKSLVARAQNQSSAA